MHSKIITLTTVFAVSIMIAACGGTPSNNTANTTKANTNNVVNAVTNTNDPTITTKKPVVETSNNATTLGPIVQSYFDALKKKDDAALQNILAAAYLKSIAADMKKEKKTGLAAYLAEYDGVSDKPVEVRNEKIEGEKALVEIKGANYLTWTPYVLAKENGAWKWTGQSPDLDSVKQSAPPPTSGK